MSRTLNLQLDGIIHPAHPVPVYPYEEPDPVVQAALPGPPEFHRYTAE